MAGRAGKQGRGSESILIRNHHHSERGHIHKSSQKRADLPPRHEAGDIQLMPCEDNMRERGGKEKKKKGLTKKEVEMEYFPPPPSLSFG